MKNFFKWRFNNGRQNWFYPCNVDMTLYRKKDILLIFKKLSFNSPNTLESAWVADQNNYLGDQYGICYKKSCIVNIPINIVQENWHNINMGSYSVYDLLRLFNNGYKIDLRPFEHINNTASHMEYAISFIKRS